MGHLTFPISVTLTALNKDPFSSSITATLLTPWSLISFIASSTLSLALVATTAVYKYNDERLNELRGFDRYDKRDVVVCE